jgi:tetratricopeptide (TPR) repeat protein
MNKKNCWTIIIVVLSVLVSCGKRETLDSQKDYILMRAMESSRNQSDKGIDVEALENSALVYEKNREWGKLCMCDAMIGYKLFAARDYDRSLIYLKKAEKNLQYCDSMSSFVFGYIVNNTMTTDTVLARHYARKALEKNLEHNNLRRLPYSYMDLSLLTKGDSARYYLEKSLECFDDWGDKVAKSKYAWWHRDELEPDTIIAYAKPCYDSIRYTGHARILAEAYLRKGEPDSALAYIEQVENHRSFKADVSFYNARRLALLGNYEIACESWEKAYYQQRDEFLFMFSQRLGTINAEYDLLNVELKNQKEKSRIRGIYNVLLVVVIVVLVVTYGIKERYRKRARRLKINVGDLEQEVSCLELDVMKRKERFSALFDEYKKGYNASRETMMADALVNLVELHKAYPELKKTDLTIIWLTFMSCSRDSICDLLNVTKKYYYQRKSVIQRILDISLAEGETWHKSLETIVRRYMQV